MWQLALILIAQGDPETARVGFDIEEVGEVDALEASLLLDELARAVEREARASVLILARPEAPCPTGSARCVGILPTTVEARLSLRIFGGLKKVRIEAVRSGTKVPTLKESADIPRDPDLARSALGDLAHRLFPKRLEPALVPAAPIENVVTYEPIVAPQIEEGPQHRPWMFAALGGAVATGIAGAAFGASSSSARDAAEVPGIDQKAFDALADRTQAHEWAAKVFFVTAGLSLATGVVLFLVDR